MDYNNYNDDDLLKEFWLCISKKTTLDNDWWNINIYAGDIHPESINIWKILYDYIQNYKDIFWGKVNVILSNYKIPAFYKISKDKLEMIDVNDFIYTTRNNINNSIFEPDLNWFSDLVSDKHLTNKLLSDNWFNTPKEVLLKSNLGLQKSMELYYNFINNISNNKLVIKPRYWERGEDVFIINNNLSFTEFYKKYLKNNWDIILQEKIDSYPIEIDENRKDWNLRVLVSYDISTKNYKSNGIVGRIWEYDNIINISKWSEFISIDELIKYLPDEINIPNITETCESIIQTISDYLDNDVSEFNVQDLSGIDIIINEDWDIIILEVNDSLSWWLYHLTKFHWLDSIDYYISNVLRKIKYYLDFKSN
jgi:hypothetical protein